MENYTSRYHQAVPVNENLPQVEYKSPTRRFSKGKITSSWNLIVRYKIEVWSYFLCSVGLLWQLSSLSASYFQYQMISKVYYLKNDTVIPPAMSLCTPFLGVIDLDKINMTHMTHLSSEILTKITIGQVFEGTPELKNLISTAWIRERNSFGIDYSLSSFQINKFTKNDDICFRLQNRFADEKSFFYKSHQITFGQHPGIIFYIGLNKSLIPNVNEVDIYLHESETYPRGDRDFPIYLGGTERFVSTDSQSLWGISQIKETFHLLPAPYDTDCKDYKSLKFETEYHCIFHCISQRFLNKYEKTVFTTVFTEPNSNLTITRDEVIDDRKYQKDLDDFLKYCRQQCPGSSCEKLYFLPMIIDTRDQEDQLVFQLFDMNGLEMIADFNSKTTLAEFTVQALSVSGVWLGLSCSDILVNLLRWIALRRKPKTVTPRFQQRKRIRSTFSFKKLNFYLT